MIKVTQRVNPCFEVFTFRVTSLIEFILLLLSIEGGIVTEKSQLIPFNYYHLP